MNDKLTVEKSIFEKHLEEWQVTKLGKFVLIKGENVIGIYDGLQEAFKEGVKRFGLDDFFIEQILPPDSVNISFIGRVA